MRLIDADELYSVIDKDMYNVSQHSSKGRAIHMGEYSHFLKRISEAPIIEAEPIIRCKDCKYWSEPNMFDSYCRKTSVSDRIIYTQPDHYCSFAERKDDA